MIAGKERQTGGKMNSKRLSVWAVVLLIGLLVVAVAAVGCGGSSDEQHRRHRRPRPRRVGPTRHTRRQQLAPYSAVPTFEAPGPAFDAKTVMAGKSILSIPGTGSDPFYVQMNKGMSTAAKAVGYPFTVWNNQGQLTQYQQGFANAITKKVSLIDLLAGPDPNALKPQIDEAQGRRDPRRLVSPLGTRADRCRTSTTTCPSTTSWPDSCWRTGSSPRTRRHTCWSSSPTRSSRREP